MSSKYESDLIKTLDEKSLYDELMPAIRKMVQSGGGADAILKKAEPLAATTLVSLLHAEKEETRRAAAKDIMERASGKPIERSAHLFGDISKMHDKDLDSQIRMLIGETGADNLIAEVLREKPAKTRGRPKGTKNTVVIDVEPEGHE